MNHTSRTLVLSRYLLRRYQATIFIEKKQRSKEIRDSLAFCVKNSYLLRVSWSWRLVGWHLISRRPSKKKLLSFYKNPFFAVLRRKCMVEKAKPTVAKNVTKMRGHESQRFPHLCDNYVPQWWVEFDDELSWLLTKIFRDFYLICRK